MRKLNHQFEAQVWYDPEEKIPTPGHLLSLVVEYEDRIFVDIECYAGYVDTDGLIVWYNRYGVSYPACCKVLAWTAWSPEYLFEPVDVHAPIRGIVKESNRGGKNTWN